MTNWAYPPELARRVDAGVKRVDARLRAISPYLADSLDEWIRSMAKDRDPAEYYRHPLAFPTLLFPWWLERALRANSDAAFQADLVYSSLCGYYHIRMLDNIMDDPGRAPEVKILPLVSFLHAEFHGVYARYFPTASPFWDYFLRQWTVSAEASQRDSALAELDAAAFLQVAARKVCAGKIPMLAVCLRNDSPEIPERWERLFDLTSAFHQMHNDVFDWQRDAGSGNRTWFLSEAEKRRQPTEAVGGWVAREGFAWGVGRLEAWLAAMQEEAKALGVENLSAWLELRGAILRQTATEAGAALQALAKLLAIKG